MFELVATKRGDRNKAIDLYKTILSEQNGYKITTKKQSLQKTKNVVFSEVHLISELFINR